MHKDAALARVTRQPRVCVDDSIPFAAVRLGSTTGTGFEPLNGASKLPESGKV